jgi:hypothetical protein
MLVRVKHSRRKEGLPQLDYELSDGSFVFFWTSGVWQVPPCIFVGAYRFRRSGQELHMMLLGESVARQDCRNILCRTCSPSFSLTHKALFIQGVLRLSSTADSSPTL